MGRPRKYAIHTLALGKQGSMIRTIYDDFIRMHGKKEFGVWVKNQLYTHFVKTEHFRTKLNLEMDIDKKRLAIIISELTKLQDVLSKEQEEQ